MRDDLSALEVLKQYMGNFSVFGFVLEKFIGDAVNIR